MYVAIFHKYNITLINRDLYLFHYDLFLTVSYHFHLVFDGSDFDRSILFFKIQINGYLEYIKRSVAYFYKQ